MNGKKKDRTFTFFNEAIEYFDKYNTEDILFNENIIESEEINSSSFLLRDQMLNELNNLREILANNPDLKVESLSNEEKEEFYNFLNYYKICPICGNQNHYFNLKKLFFDESKQELKEELIRLMKLRDKRLSRFNLNLGVPCCNCYKKIVQEF